MPTDGNLQYIEIRDFSAGLWTVADQLMPPNAAQQMIDCYAVPSGGLRAWYKATSYTTAGITSTTNEAPRMLYAHENIVGTSVGNDNYLLTYNASDTKCRLYRLDESHGIVSWNLIKTFAGGADPADITATSYYAGSFSTANLYLVFSLGANAQGADSGVWSVKYSD